MPSDRKPTKRRGTFPVDWVLSPLSWNEEADGEQTVTRPPICGAFDEECGVSCMLAQGHEGYHHAPWPGHGTMMVAWPPEARP